MSMTCDRILSIKDTELLIRRFSGLGMSCSPCLEVKRQPFCNLLLEVPRCLWQAFQNCKEFVEFKDFAFIRLADRMELSCQHTLVSTRWTCPSTRVNRRCETSCVTLLVEVAEHLCWLFYVSYEARHALHEWEAIDYFNCLKFLFLHIAAMKDKAIDAILDLLILVFLQGRTGHTMQRNDT